MLTDVMARQAKAAGKSYTLADFDGLSLFISASGAKLWHLRYTWVGQRARISLGSYPELSLNPDFPFTPPVKWKPIAQAIDMTKFQDQALGLQVIVPKGVGHGPGA